MLYTYSSYKTYVKYIAGFLCIRFFQPGTVHRHQSVAETLFSVSLAEGTSRTVLNSVGTSAASVSDNGPGPIRRPNRGHVGHEQKITHKFVPSL